MNHDDVTANDVTASCDAEPIYDDPWDMMRPSFMTGLETEYEVRLTVEWEKGCLSKGEGVN